MVNMTFTGQSVRDIRRKLQHLDRALGINPFQLKDIAFKVYHAWGKKEITAFLETVLGNQERQNRKEKEKTY